MSAFETQVGGDHYKKLAIQPTQYAMANGLDACQFSVVKYVTRHKEKGGKKDLEKAMHFLQMLIELEYPEAMEVKLENHRHTAPVSGATTGPDVDNDGWIEWIGGLPPYQGNVDVKLRDGEIQIDVHSFFLDWANRESKTDVIAWRPFLAWRPAKEQS